MVLQMQILEETRMKIKGFGTFVETLKLEMRCLGRNRIEVVHSCGIRGIDIYQPKVPTLEFVLVRVVGCN